MFSTQKNGNEVIVSCSGHIGSKEVEDTSSILDAIDAETKTVIFDLEKVDYISSSALRFFLTIRIRFPENDCVKLINCNETVYEVVKTTGFNLMMDVSKQDAEFDIDNASWKDILAYRVKNTPDFVFLTYADKDYTWKEIDIYSQIVANDLALQGVKSLSHVGIIGTNSANYIITFFALQKLGAIAVLINDKLKPDEIAAQCESGDVSAMCIGNVFPKEAIGELKSKLQETEVSIIYDISDEVDFSKRESEYEGIKHLYNEKFFADTPALMIFSSGSTGRPKAVLLSTYNFIYNSSYQINNWAIKECDCMCLPIPLFHIFGFKMGFVYSVIMNNHICIPKDSHTNTIIDMIEKEKCTLIPLVPTMLLAIINSNSFALKRIESLRMIILAGAALSKPQMIRCMELLSKVQFINLYGMSEMNPISATLFGDSAEHICDTVGVLSEDVDVKIVNPESKKVCQHNETGEILVRGTYSFLCYYKRDVEDQSTDEEGYIHTGDLGFFDDDEYLHLAGRIKDIIIRGGENILPAEITAAITSFDNIKEVMVIGIPDDFYGEVVGACISLHDKTLWNEEELNHFLSDKLADFKIPVKYVLYDELPKLGNGKVDRESMKKLLAKKL